MRRTFEVWTPIHEPVVLSGFLILKVFIRVDWLRSNDEDRPALVAWLRTLYERHPHWVVRRRRGPVWPSGAEAQPWEEPEWSARTQGTAAHRHQTEALRITRTATATGLLVVEAGLAVLGVLVHYGTIGEYGDISLSTLAAWRSGFAIGVGGVALVLVGIPAVAAALVSPRLWMRLLAGALPVLMVLGMLAVTPAALRLKLDQYDATPQCVSTENMGPGPGTRAARESQRAFESIEHVGYFGGGGGSGVGGCDRLFTLIEDVDVLQHYRAALPAAGWQVVEEGADRLRAERDGMAFEVAVCGRGGVVWAGEVGIRGVAQCDRSGEMVTGTP